MLKQVQHDDVTLLVIARSVIPKQVCHPELVSGSIFFILTFQNSGV